MLEMRDMSSCLATQNSLVAFVNVYEAGLPQS